MTTGSGLHDYEFSREERCMICAKCGLPMSVAPALCAGKKAEPPKEKKD